MTVERSQHVPAWGTVGILAGLGPLAGSYFYQRLIERTPAAEDSEHLPVVLVSDPRVPSRLANLLGCGPSPVTELVNLARLLESVGASLIAIPSSTTHAYYEQISEAVGIPVLNLLAEIARAVSAGGYRRPAILANTPTVVLDLCRPHLAPEAEPVYPDQTTQEELQWVIASLKGHTQPACLSGKLGELVQRPWAVGADCLVLACTELPLIELAYHRLPILSAPDILADAVCRLVVEEQTIRSDSIL